MYSYENLDICKDCGGKCCRAGSCLYAPEDFPRLNLDILLDLYQHKKIMFAYVDELLGVGEKGWIIRPPMENCPGIAGSILNQGVCSLLTPTGCEFDYYHKPKGGKCLIPEESHNCRINLYGAFSAIRDWLPWQDLLRSAIFIILAEERLESGPEFAYDDMQCRICGGVCCKNMGCFFSPKDFKHITVEYMKKILSKGFISIVQLTPEETGFSSCFWVLKVRDKFSNIVEPKLKNLGGCILLDTTGCMLDKLDRPYGGRALIPERFEKGMCMKGYSDRQCAQDWQPYQDILMKLVEEFTDKNVDFEGLM